MEFVQVSKDEGIATLTINRGKVNALNEPMVEELKECFEKVEKDKTIRSIILTGDGSFFSFGFDIPEFMSYSKDAFTTFLKKFTNLYTYIFLFSKPVIAALNGHTIAGGCMLATACDYRVMVSGKAKISLNEISFGSTVIAGSVEMLIYCVGPKNAESILYSGNMYSADQALQLGLIDQVSSEDSFEYEVSKIAKDFAEKDGHAFKGIKGLLRKSTSERMISEELESIHKFVDIWYSERTWQNLKEIQIHS